MRRLALLSILLLTVVAVVWAAPAAPADPENPLESQDISVTCNYRPLTMDCAPFVFGSAIDPTSDGMEMDTAWCFANGMNVVFQLRPAANAPDSLKGQPFTVDMRMDRKDLDWPGSGLQINAGDSTLGIGTSYFHKPDWSHSPLGDSATSAFYNCLDGDTLYYDFIYQVFNSPDSQGYCTCGEDNPFPHADSNWAYGHLRRFEIIHAADYTLPSRPEVIGPGCTSGSPGTVAAVCFTVGVESHPIPSVIKDYSLSTPYPNPFSVSTAMRYEIPSDGNVVLTVTNVKGEKVKTLFSGNRSAGSYLLTWDGTDENNSSLSNGVYYLEMHAKDFHNRQRVVMMR